MVIGVLLAGGLTKRGKLPYNSCKRADIAINLIKNKKISKLILSGGLKNKYSIEAKAYYDYLIKNGLKKSLLLIEEKSKDTIGNAIYSKELILKEKLDKSIILITSNFHLKRAMMIFEHIFGTSFFIEGIASKSRIFHKIKHRVIQWRNNQIDKIILLYIRPGDHKTAKKVIKKYLPMYNNYTKLQ